MDKRARVTRELTDWVQFPLTEEKEGVPRIVSRTEGLDSPGRPNH